MNRFLVIPFLLFFLLADLQPLSAQEVISPDEELLPEGDEVIEEIERNGLTEINIRNADIEAVVRIFSRQTQRNYILDERVRGKVTIYLPGRVSTDDSIRILDSVLALKGFTSVPIGDNLWKIVPSQEAQRSTIPTRTEMDPFPERPSAQMVTRLMRLQYVAAEEAQQLVSPLVSANGLVNAYTGTNSLLIIDGEDNVQRLADILDSIDIPFTDRDMTIIAVEHADASDIAAKLNEILTGGEDPQAATDDAASAVERVRARIREAAQARRQQQAGQQQEMMESPSPGGAIGARSREPKIIADERTNSIIVIADDSTTARIRALVSQLDSELDFAGAQFYVYRCQHAKADELAAVLAGLTGTGMAGRNGTGGAITRDAFGTQTRDTGFGTGTGAAFGGTQRNRANQFGRTQDRLASQTRTPGQPRAGARDRGFGGTVNLGENISITADPATNSLIIYGTKSEYEKVLFILEKLDIKRRQVLVEAMLLEVGMDDTLSLGTDWLASGGGADGGVFVQSNFSDSLSNLLSDPTQVSAFSAAAASAGSLTLPGNITIPSQAVMLSAAQSNTNVNVLSAPTILATDNEPAEIVVGQNVPFLASTARSTTDLGNVFNQVDRQDVGITLRLTPQISSQNFVTLSIFTEVSSVIAATLGSQLGPTTTVRTSETTVIARDSQMVVIGGLMADDITESESGVPFLRNIPFLGHAFRNKLEDRSRTNLLIFITPKILQDQFDARDSTIVRRDRMEDIIASYEVYPNRTEILRNLDIDRVSETHMYDGEKPGTILPPARERSSLDKKREPVQAQAKNGDQPIDIKIAPRIPQNRQSISPPLSRNSSIGDTSFKGGGSFLVLQLQGELPLGSAHPPFQIDPGNRTFGLILPEGSPAQARNFFRVGEIYTYLLDGQAISSRLVGIYSSRQEAEKLDLSPQTHWHTLSPYEIMNLGEAPWISG